VVPLLGGSSSRTICRGSSLSSRFSFQDPARVVLGGCLDVAVGWGGDFSGDWASETVAACTDRCFGLRSEAAIRAPQRRRIAVDGSFKFVFNANMTGQSTPSCRRCGSQHFSCQESFVKRCASLFA